jgi:excisionase family DNA binding protein
MRKSKTKGAPMSFVFRDLFPDDRSYRPGEIAKRFGVHVDTVRRWINEENIECLRIGKHRRIPYESLRVLTKEKMRPQANE